MEFDGVLERLEAQEAGGPDGEATLGSFRALELPPEPDGAALGRLLEVCLRLMDPREPREGPAVPGLADASGSLRRGRDPRRLRDRHRGNRGA